MDLYLDIDGVLIGTASPREDVEALISFILDRFPGPVRWLTTHCRGGENRAGEWLRGKLPDSLVRGLDERAEATDWQTLKTEAIDFTTPFLWLDDALLYTEKKILQAHGALDSWIRMDSRDPHAAQGALEAIRRAMKRQER